MSNALPYFKDMSNTELVEAYKAYRTAAYNTGNLACSVNPRSRNGRTVAAQWGRSIKACEIIEGLARRRGLRLV